MCQKIHGLRHLPKGTGLNDENAFFVWSVIAENTKNVIKYDPAYISIHEFSKTSFPIVFIRYEY